MPTIKSDKFTVKSYKLWTTQGTDMIRRVIELVSEPLTHGIIFKATLLSFPGNPYKPEVGQMTNYQGPNFDPRSLAAWIDPTAFDSFYTVLSSEAPVTFNFEYVVDPAKPDDTFKRLWSVSLTTGKENPGDFEKIMFFNFPKGTITENPNPAG